jgi:hypothetical protein
MNLKNIILASIMHTCNSSTQEADTRRSQVQSWPRLHSEFQTGQDYLTRLCFKQNKKCCILSYDSISMKWTEKINLSRKKAHRWLFGLGLRVGIDCK